jgi:deoxyribonuclease-4
MPKIGLKIWSTNLQYIPVARNLFAQKIFDYVELFVVAGSVDTIRRWQELDIPYILHAPHSYAGLNPSDPACRERNIELVAQVDKFFAALTPQFVIFHPGIQGALKESIHQFQMIGSTFPLMYKNVVIENKPLIGLNGETCLGASPEDVRRLLKETGRGFCLDFGHAICYSVASGKDWKKVISELLMMKPSMYHLCDGFFTEKDAHEHLGAGEFDLPYLIKLIDPQGFVSLETKKDRADSLDDFAEDVQQLRKYAGV